MPSKQARWFLAATVGSLGLALYTAYMGWADVFRSTGILTGLCVAGVIITWSDE